MTKARITYRFDHSRTSDGGYKPGTPFQKEKVIPLFQEEFEVIEDKIEVKEETGGFPVEPTEYTPFESLFDSNSLNSFTTEFSSWNTRIETESERVERIIRETSRQNDHQPEMEPTRERRDSQVLPEMSEQEAEQWSKWTNSSPFVQPQNGTRYTKKAGAHWLRITASIAGAVVTGVAFGFFVLSMFSGDGKQGGDPLPDKGSVTVPAASQGKPVVNSNPGSTTVVDKAEKPVTASAGTSSAIAVTIAAKSYSFLQNGVFSTQQSADTAQAEIKKKGLAAVTDGSDKFIVYAGFASTKDEALVISQQLKDKKLEVFIKNIDIPAISQVKWNSSKPDSLVSYITQGDKLIRMISGLSVIRLSEANPGPLEDSSLQAIRSSHQALTTLATSVNEGVGESVKPLLQKMNTALNSAVLSMEEFQKKPSSSMLWQAQTSMMQYILAQKEFLKVLAVV
ncbi:hypothetical protein D3C73_512120 [compost metagenome]